MVDDIVKSFNLLKDLLLLRRGERKEEIAANRNAILAVERAALATRAYLARINREPAAEAYAEESTLSQLWFEAYGRCLEAGLHDLGHRCQIKAHGWADERIWQDPRYTGIEVSLDSIVDTCRTLTGALPRE